MATQVEENSLHNRDESVSWRRWVQAACLSINGGGAISVLNLNTIDAQSQFWAIAWFVAGIVISVAFGMASSVVMAKLGGFYKKSAWDIERLADDGPEAVDAALDIPNFDRLLRQEKAVFWVQFLGLVCFTIGIIVAAEGLK